MDGDYNLEVSDEVSFPTIPKDIIFPDELNRFLRGQIEVSNIILVVIIKFNYNSIYILYHIFSTVTVSIKSEH